MAKTGEEYVVTLRFTVGEDWGGQCVCTEFSKTGTLDVDYADAVIANADAVYKIKPKKSKRKKK